MGLEGSVDRQSINGFYETLPSCLPCLPPRAFLMYSIVWGALDTIDESKALEMLQPLILRR